MDLIQKLPFILGTSAAIVAGFISYLTGVESQSVYLRMAGMMLLFFLLGILIRSTITSIKEEIQIRKIEEQRKEKEQRRRKQEEEASAEYISRFNAALNIEETENQTNEQQKQPEQPRKEETEGTDNDFEPLAMSKAIRTKISE